MKSIESVICRFIQKWIADPLQFSGVNLEFQRNATILLATACLFGMFLIHGYYHQWFLAALTGAAVLAMVGASMWSAGRYCVWQLWALLLVVDVLVLIVDFSAARVLDVMLDVAVLLNHFLNQCDPKPPRGNVKFAMEGGV
jgi:hypothetical protein